MLNAISEVLNNTALGLAPASYSAGANNGGWIDVRQAQGQINIPITVGAVTGSVIVGLQDATDGTGTGAANLSPAIQTASITTANSAAKLVLPSQRNRGWIRVVATVTTGPVFAGANVQFNSGAI